MTLETRRRFLKGGATLAAAAAARVLLPEAAKASGSNYLTPFEATWESLARYQTPDWFRDAKFGIWAHWGPQCAPEDGDWYAREMYVEGSSQNKYHVAHYGPPSQFGFKDVIHGWKAENWDPEYLVGLYKRAGAKYFFAMANHHDNFDLWDSKHHVWNAAAIGPKKNLIGGWEKAARKQGLPFGVSVHAAHAWTWYEVAQGADKMGALAGVPYDGKLTKADGKGQWWEGLDPQELYAQSHALSVGSEDPHRIHSQWNWGNGANIPSAAYCQNFYDRTVDLIDNYRPDLLYFDDTALPLWPISDVGLKIAAHFYNRNEETHRGQLKAVLFGKILDEQQRKCMVWDIERGASNQIEALPWQTDTCIGDWHYNRSRFDRRNYKSAETVIHTLVDVVSKNGNLLLNIPVRGDGTIDSEEMKVVSGITAWMAINEEAIFATRPWKVCGEGPALTNTAPLSAQGFNEGKGKPLGAEDIRFTQKNGAVYAVALGWPEIGVLRVASLSSDGGSAAKVRAVTLLGGGKLRFTQDATGLTVALPSQKPCDYAYALRIEGEGIAL